MDKSLVRFRDRIYKPLYIGSKGISLTLDLSGTAGTFVYNDLMKVPESQVWVIRSIVRNPTQVESAVIIYFQQLNATPRVTFQQTDGSHSYCEITIFPEDIVGMRASGAAGDAVRILEITFDVFYLIPV